MSMSDTCLDSARELLRDLKEGIRDERPECEAAIDLAIASLIRYLVLANDPSGECSAADGVRVSKILLAHLNETLDWGSSVESRLDDFNLILMALRDPQFRPLYEDVRR